MLSHYGNPLPFLLTLLATFVTQSTCLPLPFPIPLPSSSPTTNPANLRTSATTRNTSNLPTGTLLNPAGTAQPFRPENPLTPTVTPPHYPPQTSGNKTLTIALVVTFVVVVVFSAAAAYIFFARRRERKRLEEVKRRARAAGVGFAAGTPTVVRMRQSSDIRMEVGEKDVVVVVDAPKGSEPVSPVGERDVTDREEEDEAEAENRRRMEEEEAWRRKAEEQ